MAIHYALDAASRMIEALEQGDGLQAPAISAALRIGCHTLGLLVRDLQPGYPLHEALKRLDGLRGEHEDRISKTTDDLSVFIDTFLFLEQRALLQAGVSQKLVHFLFSDIDAVRTTLLKEELSPDLAHGRLQRLEGSVCESERGVRTRVTAERRSDQLKSSVRRGALAVGGAGLVVFNASADAITTLGLLPWMTALSGAVGATLIANAAAG